MTINFPYFRMDVSYPLGFSGDLFWLDNTIKEAASLESCDSGAGFGLRDIGFISHDPEAMMKTKKAIEGLNNEDISIGDIYVYRSDDSCEEYVSAANEPLS